MPRCRKPPVIDGRLGDACWKDAEPVPFDAGADQRHPKVRLFIRSDNTAVYFGYEREAAMAGQKALPLVATQTKKVDAQPWLDDDIEIVLTDKRREIAAQLAVSCAGGRYDGIQPTAQQGWADAKWNGEWESAARMDGGGWTAEVAVSFETLRKANIDPATLAINMVSQNLSGIGERQIFLRDPGPLSLGRCQRFLDVVNNIKPAPARDFTVRLYFAEPARLKPGERVFDVKLQDKTVLTDFDITKEAGGPNRTVVKEFRGIKASAELTVGLIPKTDAPTATNTPIISGIELLAE